MVSRLLGWWYDRNAFILIEFRDQLSWRQRFLWRMCHSRGIGVRRCE